MLTEQGAAYATFIDGELKAERERRAAVDLRGLAVVSTSGSLVTVLAAVGAFVSSAKDFVLPGLAVPFLLITLGAFTVAVVLGIFANRSRYYDVALPETLKMMVTSHWGDDLVDARNHVADLNIRTIHTLRVGNDRKAQLVTWALWAQLAAVTSLSVAIGLVLMI